MGGLPCLLLERDTSCGSNPAGPISVFCRGVCERGGGANQQRYRPSASTVGEFRRRDGLHVDLFWLLTKTQTCDAVGVFVAGIECCVSRGEGRDKTTNSTQTHLTSMRTAFLAMHHRNVVPRPW